MKTRTKMVMAIFVLIVASACGFMNRALNQAEEIPSLAAKLATEVLTTVEAQITEVAPTLESQMETLPTVAAKAGENFTDFNGVPNDVLQKVFDRTMTLSSYRMDVTVSQGETITSDMKYEVIPPDKMHVIIDSNGDLTEQIMVGKDAYMKIGESWMKIPLDIQAIYGLGIEMFRNNVKDVKLVGPETVDGTPLMVFEYTYDLNGVVSTSKVWVGMLDGYIHRTEGDSTIDGKLYHTITKIYDFNEPITIEPPVQ